MNPSNLISQNNRAVQEKFSAHRFVHFPTQRPNEHVVLLLRRHWTILAYAVVHLIVFLLIPPLIIFSVIYFGDDIFDTQSIFYILLVLGSSLYYLFVSLGYFHNFVDYHLDIWVVTDQRIIAIEQEGLFKRVISELNILKVQDVTSEVRGKMQTFLDYGQVHIQTAGRAERFVFEEVAHPSEVAKIILQVHDQALKLQELQEVKETEEYRHQIDQEEAKKVNQVNQ
ncbi:MAG: hypothetical protein A2233_01295 [Candidatus Kerfeldbacteria bacterium RIFOXYA2_FULL_38_24]|uniref:YdbS-like PH domain-containing protein n=1 Tax=Candidatus Kerfeldbacteria bacterium RIFOXYB2_FULL_38_14 TaxID=1798547 RepID=A0A1G2BGF9_9BACT|nr:MAG: hypothetical protein A2233_01295 [Candidatus Kerfeldbacteria bacterium RIFOXYA2_FULL_38_24]OGY87370.1 MAG: hypothetical protein A2319_05385 [Candidatus Kerfeldbacteria bacterium RIFOXYB2_FULL_38_14]OGY88852.1 MAG: hypothetical protein A2458_04330 [Candidatus Kerfeldbacteria bacterium RIFOXYC2_FULL_38_9]